MFSLGPIFVQRFDSAGAGHLHGGNPAGTVPVSHTLTRAGGDAPWARSMPSTPLAPYLGLLFQGFFLIPALGVTGTIYLAGVFNLMIGGTGFWLYWNSPETADRPEPALTPIKQAQPFRRPPKAGKKVSKKFSPLVVPEPLSYSEKVLKGLLAGYALSGFAALVYEIAWFRVLSLLIGSTVYAFSLMLTAFVLGIAIGSMVFARFVDRIKNPLQALFIIQLGIGGSALVVVPFVDQLPFMVTGILAQSIDTFWAAAGSPTFPVYGDHAHSHNALWGRHFPWPAAFTTRSLKMSVEAWEMYMVPTPWAISWAPLSADLSLYRWWVFKTPSL